MTCGLSSPASSRGGPVQTVWPGLPPARLVAEAPYASIEEIAPGSILCRAGL
jgi:hypothetical protein